MLPLDAAEGRSICLPVP